MSSHTRRNRATALGVGSAATSAPLMAPTDVPTIRSGLIPLSKSARSIPTSAAPSTPPPPRTKAVPPVGAVVGGMVASCAIAGGLASDTRGGAGGSRPGQNRQDPHQVVPELLHEVLEEASRGLVDDLPVVAEALRRELDVGLG